MIIQVKVKKITLHVKLTKARIGVDGIKTKINNE